MSWRLKIHEPSGEARSVPILGETHLGRSERSEVFLKDPTVATHAAMIWPVDPGQVSPFWIKIPSESPAARLGGLSIREAHLPSLVPFQLGETKLVIEPATESVPLPPFPPGVRPWLTRTEEGRSLLWMTKKTAETSLSIYLAGETGTGKEVLAQLIHAWSPRRAGPFVPLHCGALPISLAESELFGHVKGAFTGASQHRPGALMQAHGGTLFLDEIGDLPLDIQVKLLRFLENGELRPVGADRPTRVDVRLIAATHQPLQQLVAEGKFRRDLFYRVASVTLQVPPLRSRPEDISLLARQFAEELHQSLSPKAILRLQAHAWPGNVRELRHAIERASGLAGVMSRTLSEENFEFLLTANNLSQTPELEFGAAVLSLHEMERVLLLKALKITRGNRAKAAVILGVARSTLFEMIKRHKIKGPRGPA